jgi:uncharacterized protein (DUF58 family)
MLAVDLSGSLDFGTHGQFKRDLLAELAATVAFSAAMNNDKIGLLAFTDRVELFVPPRKGTKHVMRIVRELLALRPEGRGTAIGPALEELGRVLRQRSVLFVVSDFHDDSWDRPMRMARRRHDVVPVVVEDHAERELPPMGLVEFTDSETGERRLVDTSRRSVRRRFAEAAERRAATRDRLLRGMRLDPIEITTGEDFVAPLSASFRRRERRRAR